MKRNILFSLLLVILLTHCASTGPKNVALDLSKGYLAAEVEYMHHIFQLKNLDTDEKINIRFSKNKKYTVLEELPEGRYAILEIRAQDKLSSITFMPPKIYFRPLIVVPGSVTYLGKYTYASGAFFRSNIPEISFDLDALYNELSERYSNFQDALLISFDR